eukprot:IDg14116t1
MLRFSAKFCQAPVGVLQDVEVVQQMAGLPEHCSDINSVHYMMPTDALYSRLLGFAFCISLNLDV